MTLTRSNGALVWAAAFATLITADLHAESRFTVPFENFRRTHDSDEFGKQERKALEQPAMDLGEDVAYLAAVCSEGKEPFLQDQALQALIITAFQTAQLTTKPVDAFRPAAAVFENHLDDALADVNSKWAAALLSLTALAGLQPSPRAIPLFYRIVGESTKLTDEALLALARLSPRPAEAKRILLERSPNLDRDERMEILAFALDDPDFLAIFARSLESEDAYEQRRAIKYLVHVGPLAKPALEILYRLQQRPNLDKEVAANTKTAIVQIEGAK